MDNFSQSVIETIGHYVYCLVDPRDNRIFYIGEGQGNRVFQHANDSLNESLESDKLDTIREIRNQGKQVIYYIIRHGLDEKQAFEIESVLIDMLTYNQFNLETVLTNIQAGHHQWDRGIKTADEIQLLYDCKDITPNPIDKILLININKTYNKNGNYDIYEATRKSWKLKVNRACKATVVLSVYRNIVRAVFKNIVWTESQPNSGRYEFIGDEDTESPYLNKSTKSIIYFNQNPIRYYNM